MEGGEGFRRGGVMRAVEGRDRKGGEGDLEGHWECPPHATRRYLETLLSHLPPPRPHPRFLRSPRPWVLFCIVLACQLLLTHLFK